MSEERTVELKGGHLFDSLNYFSSFKFQVYNNYFQFTKGKGAQSQCSLRIHHLPINRSGFHTQHHIWASRATHTLPYMGITCHKDTNTLHPYRPREVPPFTTTSITLNKDLISNNNSSPISSSMASI
eukprot:sb/3475452/